MRSYYYKLLEAIIFPSVLCLLEQISSPISPLQAPKNLFSMSFWTSLTLHEVSHRSTALREVTAPCLHIGEHIWVHAWICRENSKTKRFLQPQGKLNIFFAFCLSCFPEEKKKKTKTQKHWTFLAESCHLQWKADYTVEVNNKSMILSGCLG